MGRVRRRFDAAFKETVCQQVLGGQELREICQDHQLSRQTVERWVELYQQGAPLGRPSAVEKAQAREIEKLHAKIGQMAVQIDLLKKIQKTSADKKSVDGWVITASNLAQFQKRAKR